MLQKKSQLSLILTIAFMQGALEFYQLPMFYFYKDELGINISTLSLIQGLILIPWILKPFLGFLSDTFTFCGSRKKSYLIITCIIEMLGYFILATLPNSVIFTVFLQIINQTCVVFRNVIGETILVTLARDDSINKSEAGNKQSDAQAHVSYFFGARNCGSLVFSYLGGFALEFLNKTQIFQICALFPFTVLINCIFFYKEKNQNLTEVKDSFQKMVEDIGIISRVLTDPRIKDLLVMVLFLIISPNLGPTFNFYFTEYLKFTPETMGEISFISSLAYLIGIFSLNTLFKGIDFKYFYITTSFISAFMSSSSLILLFEYNKSIGISDKFFCLSSSAVQNFIAEINFLPLLSLCCLYCPKNLEGTTYAVFTALFNLANYLSTLLGSILVYIFGVSYLDFSNLWILVILQTTYSLIGVFFLNFISFPKVGESKNDSKHDISCNDFICSNKDNLNMSRILN